MGKGKNKDSTTVNARWMVRQKNRMTLFPKNGFLTHFLIERIGWGKSITGNISPSTEDGEQEKKNLQLFTDGGIELVT